MLMDTVGNVGGRKGDLMKKLILIVTIMVGLSAVRGQSAEGGSPSAPPLVTNTPTNPFRNDSAFTNRLSTNFLPQLTNRFGQTNFLPRLTNRFGQTNFLPRLTNRFGQTNFLPR